jgi:hypothetical protein
MVDDGNVHTTLTRCACLNPIGPDVQSIDEADECLRVTARAKRRPDIAAVHRHRDAVE